MCHFICRTTHFSSLKQDFFFTKYGLGHTHTLREGWKKYIQIMNVYECHGTNIFIRWKMKCSIQQGLVNEWAQKYTFFSKCPLYGKNVLKSSNWKCGFHSNGYGLFQKLDAHPNQERHGNLKNFIHIFHRKSPLKKINHFFSHKGKEDMEIPRKFNLTVLVKKWEFPMFFLFLVQIIEFPNFIKFSEFPFFWKKKSSLGIPRSLTKNVLVFVRGCADYNSFAIAFSKQVISLPSQTCTYRVKVAETSYVVRADIIEIQSKKQQFYNLVSCRFFPPWNTFAEVWTGECLSKI